MGGSIHWSWGEYFNWESRIEAWEPKRFLRAVYTRPPGAAEGPAPPAPVRMDFILGTREGKTVLRLVHSGFGTGAAWNEEYDGTSRGWQYELRSLRHYLEHHRGTPRRVAWVRAPLAFSFEDSWKRLADLDGLFPRGALAGLRAGDRYELAAATGEALAGMVITCAPPREFSGTVESLNNALFRVMLDACAGKREAWVWLSAWGLPQAEVDAFHARWQAQLQRLFS